MRIIYRTIFISIALIFLIIDNVYTQCNKISAESSSQDISGFCAPVQLDFGFKYTFINPVNPDSVEIYIDWGDGTDITFTPNKNGLNTAFYDTLIHNYPPTGTECVYTALSYVIYNGNVCLSSEQAQDFRSWNVDNQNGGQIEIAPNPAEFCLGDTIVQQFEDVSTFNCNPDDEPDKPNDDDRWIQFIYNTNVNGGDRIPNVFVDSAGILVQLTDANGNSLGILYGPIVQMNSPVTGPNQLSYNVVAPGGGKVGDIFEVTMRNWNICNPYDDPAIPSTPVDVANGDNAPIETTAYIEIITTPLTVPQTYFTHCTGETITLSASGPGGSVIRWYSDSLLTNLLHTGGTWNPAQAPDSVISNNVGGTHIFWVTATDNGTNCQSLPQKVIVEIIESPTVANAGVDSAICSDNIILYANEPTIGAGAWLYGGSGNIVNTSAYNSVFNTIPEGANSLTWQITNGPCVSSDNVVITRDLQPSPANAGTDTSFCDVVNLTLYATPVDNNGVGLWSVFSGGATITSPNLSNSIISNIAGDSTVLVWEVNSANNACAASYDTLILLHDLAPDPANAGTNQELCDSSQTQLQANAATNDGTGQWNLVSGTGNFQDAGDPQSNVTSISFGTNVYEWSIASKHGVCATTMDSVTVTRYENVTPANAGADTSYCEEYTSILNANNPLVGTGEWQVLSNPSSNDPTFSSVNDNNATIDILPGDEGVYTLLWQITNGSCSSGDLVTIDFGKNPPPADAGAPDTTCGTTGQLNATLFIEGTPSWALVSGLGGVSYSPSPNHSNAEVTINPGNEGLYTFEWVLSSGSCEPTRDTTTLLFNPLPQIPVVTSDSSCGSTAFTFNPVNGPLTNTNKWYDSPSGGSLLHTGTSYSTPVLSSTANYWVSSINDTTGCESARQGIQAIINPSLGEPSWLVNPNCGPGDILIQANIISNANTNKWYDVPVGGTELSVSKDYTALNVTSTSLFYVSPYNTLTGCEGIRDTVEVTIYPLPEVLTLTDTSSCGQSSFTLEAATTNFGNTVRWYSDSNSITHFLEDTIYTTPIINSDTTFWLSSYNDTLGCESNLTPLNIQIFPLPDEPATTDTVHCGPDNFTLKPAKGNNTTHLRWYYFPAGGSLVLESDSFQTPFLINNTTYYVSGYDSVNMCESSRSSVEVQIIQLPTPQDIIGKDKVVVNETGVIYSVDYHAGSTYEWTIASEIDLIEDNGSWVRLGFPNIGAYNISVQETRFTCVGPINQKPITITDGQLEIDLSTHNLEACTGTGLLLEPSVVGGISPYTIMWTGDSAYLSSTSDLRTFFNAPALGNYILYLSVTDLNYNTAQDTIYIEAFSSPTAEILVPDTFTCLGDDQPITVDYNSSTLNNIHAWEGQITALSASDVPNPVFIPFDIGTYNLFYQIIDENSCVAYDTLSMYVEAPAALFTHDKPAGCSPLSVGFENNSPSAYEELSWNFTDTVINNVEKPVYTFENTTPYIKYYNVTLTITTENGCSDDYISAITVHPNPVATINTNILEACSPANIIFTSNQGGVTYNWDFGDGEQIQTGFTTAHTYDEEILTDKTYTVKLITTSTFNCVDSSTAEMLVHPSPDVDFTATPLEQMFPDTVVNITNLTEGNWEYKWYFGDGTESLLKNPWTHAYQTPNHYNVSLVARNTFCKDSLTKQIVITPHPPIAKFAPVDPGCMPHTVTFKNQSDYADKYFWDFGDGNISNKVAPVHTYYEPGIYKIKLMAQGEGGENEYSDTSRVYVLPNSFFDLAPRTVFVNDEEVHYFNLSDNADMVEWDFGDGTTSSEYSPKHTYQEEGVYSVVLKVWTDNNCYDIYEKTNAVEVEPAGTIAYPSGFRPLSNIPENRVFVPGIVDNVEDYHLMVFNRWGDLIFESFDRQEGWDGFYNGKIAKQDVYIWKVTGTYNSGAAFIKTGDVTLFH